MSQRVMGMETEYAISGQDANGDSVEKSYLVNELVQVAAERLVNLPAGVDSGLFLSNGSRFYRDAGSHPELSSPECLTPWELVRFVTAGDHILRDLSQVLCERIGRGSSVEIAKVNVDYSGSGSTWGCHESYAHQIRNRAFFRDLIPHLVSRIIYSGAGGFNSVSPGLEFTLSPRAHHMVDAVTGTSTNDRGIVHSKNEDLTGGTYNRLHLLCGESLYSQTSAVLKIGTTALVVALLEQGRENLAAWHLDDPVFAMKTIATDPSCRIKVDRIGGSSVSASEIQKHYLTLIENNLGSDWLPDWAEDLCQLWRQTLDRLDDAPTAVCGTLDWAIKHVFFEKLIRERGFDADRIALWNNFQDQVFLSLVEEKSLAREQVLSNLLVDGAVNPLLKYHFKKLLHAHGHEREEFSRFLALRRDLFMLDTRFNTVGTDCIFASLQGISALNHELPEVGDIAHAMTEAPDGTRAYLRGKAIKTLAEQKGENFCGWDFVTDQVKGLQLDLRDPFTMQETWEPIQLRRRSRPRFLRPSGRSHDFLDLLLEMDL